MKNGLVWGGIALVFFVILILAFWGENESPKSQEEPETLVTIANVNSSLSLGINEEGSSFQNKLGVSENETSSPIKAKKRVTGVENSAPLEQLSNQVMARFDENHAEPSPNLNDNSKIEVIFTTDSKNATPPAMQAQVQENSFSSSKVISHDEHYNYSSSTETYANASHSHNFSVDTFYTDQNHEEETAFSEEAVPESQFVSDQWIVMDSYGMGEFASEFFPYLDYQLKFRMGAFFPSQKIFRGIYGNAIPIYEGEAAKFLGMGFNGVFQGWANISWLSKRGKAAGIPNQTHIKMATLGLGFNWAYFWAPELMSYIGVGPALSRVYISNNTLCGQDIEYKYSVGCLVKSGIQYAFQEHFFAEVFADYFYLPVNYEQKRNLGGIKVGAGLGMNF